jgi:hypothetical protein
LTPAHQFPLGVTLHPRRRREAAEWGGVVIEDDYDGESRYDRQPVGALQALAPDHVINRGQLMDLYAMIEPPRRPLASSGSGLPEADSAGSCYRSLIGKQASSHAVQPPVVEGVVGLADSRCVRCERGKGRGADGPRGDRDHHGGGRMRVRGGAGLGPQDVVTAPGRARWSRAP